MDALSLRGRQMVFWGALLLLGWAVYELSIRFEEMLTWLSPVYSLVRDGKITWMDYLNRVNWSRLRTHLFLIVCIIFALFALLARKSPILAIVHIPIAILLGIFSLGSTRLMDTNLWQKLKLIPLVLVAVGSALKVAGSYKKKKAQPGSSEEQPTKPPPYDPFRMNRP